MLRFDPKGMELPGGAKTGKMKMKIPVGDKNKFV